MAVGRMQSALLCSAIAALAAAAPAAQQQPNAKGFCARYARFGLAAVEGCHACEKSMPEKVPACMKCGTTCKKMHCSGPSDASCGKKQAFKACHAKCTAAPVAQQQPAAKGFCAQIARFGPAAVAGCQACEKLMPKKVPACVKCGTTCRKMHCTGPSDATCGKKQAFKACHAKCTAAPAAQQQPAAAKKPADPKACSKYATLGPATAKGCEICHKFMPLKVDTCMSCGTKCRKQVCGGKDSGACGKSPAFKSCHRSCVQQPTGKQAKALQQPTGKQAKALQAACGKYGKWSKGALAGCGKCFDAHPGKVDACMDCGRMCSASACRGLTAKECPTSAAYKTCHRSCMAMVGRPIIVV